MTLDDAKYFCEKARFLERERFLHNCILPTDSYEECEDKLLTVTGCFPHESEVPWEYFKAIYNGIPVRFRMPLMLSVLYQYYDIDYVEMLQCMSNYINVEETAELKAQRIAGNVALLKDGVRKDGTVMVYRGMAENSLIEEYAVSYTLDKKTADFFVGYHKGWHGSRFGVTIKKFINIEDIMYYSNHRGEKEVYVIPLYVADMSYRGLYYLTSREDLWGLKIGDLRQYLSNEEYNAVLAEYEKSRHKEQQE